MLKVDLSQDQGVNNNQIDTHNHQILRTQKNVVLPNKCQI